MKQMNIKKTTTTTHGGRSVLDKVFLVSACVFIFVLFIYPNLKENQTMFSTLDRATPDCSVHCKQCLKDLLASEKKNIKTELRLLDVEKRLVEADKRLIALQDPSVPNPIPVDVTEAKVAEVKAEERAVEAEKHAVDIEKELIALRGAAAAAADDDDDATAAAAAASSIFVSPMLPRSIIPVVITPQTFALNSGARKAHVHKCASVVFDMFVHDPALCKFISAQLLRGGWECPIINSLAKVMAEHPGESFMDIGSNVGAFSLTFAHLGYKVFAFEAMMFNAELQVASIGSFPMKGELNLFNMAVADKTGGELCIHAANDIGYNSGNGQISPGPCSAKDEIVPRVAIQDVMKHYYPDVCIAAIKIDVEGYEGHALRGAENLFTGKCPPCAVFMEYNKEYTLRAGLPERVAFDFLEKHGFKCVNTFAADYTCVNPKCRSGAT